MKYRMQLINLSVQADVLDKIVPGLLPLLTVTGVYILIDPDGTVPLLTLLNHQSLCEDRSGDGQGKCQPDGV